jgi:methionine biosynthesis protein MetW
MKKSKTNQNKIQTKNSIVNSIVNGDAAYQERYFQNPKAYEEDVFKIPRGKDLPKLFGTYIKKGMKVLDLGCGIGLLAKELNKYKIDLHGADITEWALNEARKKGYKTKLVNLEENLPFESNSFDVVICLETIEHMHNVTELMTEINRILKKGGATIISTPNSASLNARLRFLLGQKILTMQAPSHIQSFVCKELKEIMHKAKFKEIKITSTYIPIVPGITPFTPVAGSIVSWLGKIKPSFGDTFIIIAKK